MHCSYNYEHKTYSLVYIALCGVSMTDKDIK